MTSDAPRTLRIVSRRADPDRLELSGALDAGTCGMLVAVAGGRIERGARGIRVDAAGLRSVDRDGLAALLELARRARAFGRCFELTAVSEPLARLTEVTGASALLRAAWTPAGRE